MFNERNGVITQATRIELLYFFFSQRRKIIYNLRLYRISVLPLDIKRQVKKSFTFAFINQNHCARMQMQ